MDEAYIRCSNEHYYKPSEYKECPYCKKYASEIAARHSEVIRFEIPSSTASKKHAMERPPEIASIEETEMLQENNGETELLQNGYEETMIISEERDE